MTTKRIERLETKAQELAYRKEGRVMIAVMILTTALIIATIILI